MKALHMFLDNTQHQKFFLTRDSLEDDPEIYANNTTTYPNRISYVLIRKYANDSRDQQRLKRVFARYPAIDGVPLKKELSGL